MLENINSLVYIMSLYDKKFVNSLLGETDSESFLPELVCITCMLLEEYL